MELQLRPTRTDEEINELADWMQSLSIEQIFWLKESYEQFQEMLAAQAQIQTGCAYVH